VPKHRVIVVAVLRREAERNRQEPGALRFQVEPVRIGAAHDQGEVAQHRLRREPEGGEQRVEGAELAVVLKKAAGQIIGDAARLLRDRQDLVGLDEQERRRGVEEARDEPGTGDAVDLGRRRVTQVVGAPPRTTPRTARCTSGKPAARQPS
jgi:hypothetical protein